MGIARDILLGNYGVGDSLATAVLPEIGARGTFKGTIAQALCPSQKTLMAPPRGGPDGGGGGHRHTSGNAMDLPAEPA